MTVQIWLLAAFVALQLGVGLFIGRRVRSAADFFVAGRRLPAPLVFASFLAANIGAGSTVGAASIGYQIGLGAWWWNGSAGIGSLLLAAWAGPRLWQLAYDRGFLTVGDFFEWRYGRAVRAAAGVLVWVVSLAILAGQLVGASSILQVVLDWPRSAGAMAGGLIAVVYFVAGGLLSSAWVNLVQLSVKLVGFALALAFALSMVGGWEALAAAPGVPPTFASWWGPPSGSRNWFSLVMLLVPAFVVSPGLVQKAYGADSQRSVRIGVGLNAVGLLLFAICPAVLGMVARVLHPDLTDVNLALPTLLAEDMPPLVGTLTLAAVLAAEISSADAVLLMLSTSLSQDLYRRFVAPGATDDRVLLVARGAAIVAGAVGVGMAVVIPTVVDALSVFYSVITATLFIPIAAALVTRRGGQAECLAAMGVGLVAWVVAAFVYPSIALGVPPPAVGLLASAAAFGATLVTRGAR
jgi:SSS family solute:Na+ symporter